MYFDIETSKVYMSMCVCVLVCGCVFVGYVGGIKVALLTFQHVQLWCPRHRWLRRAEPVYDLAHI